MPSGCARCRCGFESSPVKSSTRRPFVEVYVPAPRIDPKNAKVNAIKFGDGEVVHRQMLDLRKVEARHILQCNNLTRASVGHLNADTDFEGACWR